MGNQKRSYPHQYNTTSDSYTIELKGFLIIKNYNHALNTNSKPLRRQGRLHNTFHLTNQRNTV